METTHLAPAVILSRSPAVILSEGPAVILSEGPAVILSEGPAVILSEARDRCLPRLLTCRRPKAIPRR
jgi:hypothetical protein